MILVSKNGRRVVNEKRSYSERTRVHFAWDPNEAEFPNQVLFMVYDQRTAELFAGNYPLPPPGDTPNYLVSAPDPAALATAIQQRLDSIASRIGAISLHKDFAKNLAAQISEYSVDAISGEDRQFARGKYPYDGEWHTAITSKPRDDTKWAPSKTSNITMYPFAKQGPLYAILLAAGTLDTNGGPLINTMAQILDTLGAPIPGLYGAGNCIASPAGQAYWGAGGTIGPAITFGTIAGRQAAAETPRSAA
jgi:3-oxosteroid 1-dehydrogenase